MSENNLKPPKKQDTRETKLLPDNHEECEKIEEVVVTTLRKLHIHIGPLPDPDTLKKYNEILPDAADRIFRMAEKSQNHDHNREICIIENEIKKINKGQNFALIITILGLTGAVICAALNQPVVGSVIGGSTLASIAASFLTGRKKKEKEESEKGGDMNVEKNVDNGEKEEKEHAQLKNSH